MIIGSNFKMNIGERYYGLRDHKIVSHPDQPYVVLREATFEEWLEDYENDLGHKISPDKALKAKNKAAGFYLISID